MYRGAFAHVAFAVLSRKGENIAELETELADLVVAGGGAVEAVEAVVGAVAEGEGSEVVGNTEKEGEEEGEEEKRESSVMGPTSLSQ